MASRSKGAALWAAELKARGETQRQAAAGLDVHETHAGKVLAGERLPGRRMAWDIYQRYGVPVESWDEPEESAA